MMMVDREKVIKAIEICYTLGHNCTECPLFSEDDCNDKLMHDALTLLKEQEAVKPVRNNISPNDWFCGKCGAFVSRMNNYCPQCGREVKWE